MIKKELLLASWLEKLQKKWDNEEYYYDVEEATKPLTTLTESWEQ